MKLKIKYGMDGYGLYWTCLELITDDIRQSNITFELKHDAELLAELTYLKVRDVEEMMVFMVNLGLFQNTNGTITCLSILKRLDQSMTSSVHLRKLLTELKSHDKVMINPDLVMQDKTRLDKTRPDKKEQRASRFTPPTVDQVKDYCLERQNKINPEDFIDYYQANGWMRGRSKIKDWKACVRTWEKFEREDKKPKPKSDRDWQTLGAEKGINAKPGESMWNYISRVKEGVYGH